MARDHSGPIQLQRELNQVVEGKAHTIFQRRILAQLRNEFDIPRYTRANRVVIRRACVRLLKEHSADFRHEDIDWHCSIIVPLVCVPTQVDIEVSQAMVWRRDAPSRLRRWFNIATRNDLPMTLLERREQYVPPPN
jgi:hypothetical protein